MKHMRSLIPIVLFILSAKSFSCSCVEIKPINYIENCNNVYSSTLLEAKLITLDDKPIIEGRIGEPIEIYKGSQTTNNIYSVKSNGNCYTNILVGENYLVCEKNEGKVFVSQCTYTRPMIWDSTDELINEIKDMANK